MKHGAFSYATSGCSYGHAAKGMSSPNDRPNRIINRYYMTFSVARRRTPLCLFLRLKHCIEASSISSSSAFVPSTRRSTTRVKLSPATLMACHNILASGAFEHLANCSRSIALSKLWRSLCFIFAHKPSIQVHAPVHGYNCFTGGHWHWKRSWTFFSLPMVTSVLQFS